ncbi:MAG: hypothetical protein EPO21_11995 [Chloroflexota bacterium]|nr:MAG: hypothetical protein EPO21_11995 [Chloroflexota bacterium]
MLGSVFFWGSETPRIQSERLWSNPTAGKGELVNNIAGLAQATKVSWAKATLIVLVSVLVAALVGAAVADAGGTGGEYAFVLAWPANNQSSNGKGLFFGPSGVAVDSAGNVYVADQGNQRIQKFTSSGTFITKWGSPGNGNGQFSSPSAVAVDTAGNVYVADTGNQRIQKFTSSGAFITEWGSQGSGDDQFSSPSAIAVDSTGNVYVADSANHRIQKFTSSGGFIAKWGSPGTGDGRLNSPVGVAVDSLGYVYVTDSYSGNVQVFTSTGTFVRKWDSWDGGSSVLAWPNGIAVDSSGNVYVADLGNFAVEKFTSTGTYLATLGYYGSGSGQFLWASGVAVDSAGNLHVADTGNDRVQKFNSSGAYVTKWGSTGGPMVGSSADGQFASPSAIALDSAGNVYVADSGNNRIQKFTSAGTFVSKMGTYGSTAGKLNWPSGVALDSAGNVYVADSGNNRIQKFSSAGAFLAILGFKSCPKYDIATGTMLPGVNGGLCRPTGIALDSAGNIYVTDAGNDRVQKLSSSGAFLTKWGSTGTGDGQFDGPTGIALDSAGNVYVADSGNNRIQKFSGAGTFLTKWGSKGGAYGQFDGAYTGIAVDAEGDVYVADSGNDRIQKFTSAGTFIATWGSFGVAKGQFDGPSGVVVNSLGKVYVADSHNQRIEMFAPPPDLVATNLTAPMAGIAGRPISVAWTVTNQGATDAEPFWNDRVYLSTDTALDGTDVFVASVSHGVTLTAGSSYSVSQSVTVPKVAPGDYYLILRTDMYDAVTETDEANNAVAIPFTVQSTDLVPTAFTAPITGFAGQGIALSWTVKNQGNADAAPAWEDRVYLSTDMTLDSTDTYVTRVTHDTALAAESSYGVSQTVNLPRVGPGDYYLILRTDMYKAVTESNETNNSDVIPFTIQATDLDPTAFTAPVTALAGQSVAISWTVKNQGDADAAPAWEDRVYLSTDMTLDSTDTYVTRVTHDTALMAGSSYGVSQSVTAPKVAPGNYFLILRADMYNAVIESSEMNNSVAIPFTIQSTDLVPTAFTAPTIAPAGQSVALSWTVKNQGNADAASSWEDRVYLSTDTTLDSTDTYVTRITQNTALTAGISYGVSQTVNSPRVTPGDYYLILRTDMYNHVAEFNETNNNLIIPMAITP